MNYDFRNRAAPPPYNAQIPMYRQPASASSTPSIHPMYGHSLYPKVGQPGRGHNVPASRASSFNHTSAPTSSSSSGLGIKVALKPEYGITHPPQLAPQAGDIPRSNFQFDFELERKIVAEVERGGQNWSRLGLENLPSNATESTSSVGSVADPVVSKYIASGLNREAVPIAVTNYGDNPTKVREFVNGFIPLREMGFSSSSVAEALLMYDNDTEKALSHLLNSSS
ncbi:hypothetical protein SLE2022_373550 [Rubroshorea leprosula]